MIYLDNAATTFPKPPEVEHAVMAAFHTIGNAGRGAHAATLDASRIIYGTRERLAELFHAEDASRIAFTANVTESLNIAIQGLFEPGDHVITSVCEHNSVLRPLYLMEQRGVKVTYLPADSKGRIAYDELENAYEPETKAVVIMHASNLTGNVTDLEQIAAFTQKYHLLFVVDAAQTAGVLPIDVQKQNIDVLCFTGHKGLFGPQGTGGIYVRKGVEIRPLFAGGTGVQSYSRTQPKEMPTLLSLASVPIIIICFPLVPKLVAKFGKKTTLMFGVISSTVLSVIIFAVKIPNVYVYSVLNVLAMIGQTVFTMLIWALVTDCLDYSEWKFHERSDGSMYSLYTFSRKIGSTIASAGVSFGLQAIGYISGNNVVQSDATINNIYMLVALIPVLTCVLELIGIGAIFNLDKEQTKEMYAELKQRRE